MVLRLNGLSSGMDIDSVVKNLMQAQKVPVDKMKQQKQSIEWQREAYQDLNKKILDFRNNKLNTFKMQSTLGAKKTTITGDSQAFTASARADAPNGSLSLKVLSLATPAKMTGSDLRGVAGKNFDPSKPLGDPANQLTLQSNYSFSINGTQIDVDTSKDSLNDVIARISQKTNVNAFYDSYTGQVNFTTKSTGENADITFTGDTNNFLTGVLKMPSTVSAADKAANAVVEINGILTQRESNSFTVNNINIVLQQKSVFTGVVGNAADESDPTKYKASTIGVSSDTDKIMDAIKGFISSYNDVLKSMQDKIGEKKNADYQPLTDDQREAMKEDEITLWETKAKTGLLHNDSIFSSSVNSLRSMTTSIVSTGNNAYNSLSAIGIGSTSYLDNGKLTLNDETKLRAAIEADPNAVMALFSATGNGDSDTSDVGIAQKMYDSLKTTLDNVGSKAGTSVYSDSFLSENSIMGKQLSQLAMRITDAQARLTDIESAYYQKFSVMEQAINNYNSQSSMLAGAFSGG